MKPDKRRKLSDADIVNIKLLVSFGVPVAKIARDYNVASTALRPYLYNVKVLRPKTVLKQLTYLTGQRAHPQKQSVEAA